MSTPKTPLYAYGLHAVQALLEQAPQRIRQLFLQHAAKEDRNQQTIVALAKAAGIAIQMQSRSTLDNLVEQGVHQGVVAHLIATQQYDDTDLATLLDKLEQPAFLLILDGVQDPHNLGACLRSANAAGVHAVIVPKDKSAPLTAVAYKAASGAADVTPLIRVTNLARTMEKLKQRGIWLYGASDSAQQPLYAADLKGSIAWVLGAEGDGLRRLTRDTCDALYAIPMQGAVSSLNVSVATGICLFEAVRQRAL